MRHRLKLLNLVLIGVFIFSFTACTTAKTAVETTAAKTTIPETTTAAAASAEKTEATITVAETTAAETTLPETTAESTIEKIKYKVGDRGPAGGFIIFVNSSSETAEGEYLEAAYINSSSDPDWEYLEAAPYDQWDNESDHWITWEIAPSEEPGRTTGATATAIGTGMSNTKKIVNVWGEGNYAAKICYDLTINGYSDWALPSKDELNLMYTVLAQNSAGGFEADAYWSSTECGGVSEGATAWIQWMDSGDQSDTSWKQYTSLVRAVRVGMSLGYLDDESLN